MVKFVKKQKSSKYDYLCPNQKCQQNIPRKYVEEYKKYPPAVTSAIGFTSHGKTVYFSALFYAFKHLRMVQQWENFYYLPLNEESLEVIGENVKKIENGELPDATPQNFPKPTIVRLHGVPMKRNCTMLFYDVAGDVFEKVSRVEQYAEFVKHARTAIFLIDITNLNDIPGEMDKLLMKYIYGMDKFHSDTKKQHLVIVYPKAELLTSFLKGYCDVLDYLLKESSEHEIWSDADEYITNMYKISNRLKHFTQSKLKAVNFFNAANENFKSISFSLVSSLGAQPDGDRLFTKIVPRRILDPILWMIEKSPSQSESFFSKIRFEINS